MLIECNLQSIKEFLEKESITCSLEKSPEETSLDYLVLDMGEDEEGRPQLIELFAVEKEVRDFLEEKKQPSSIPSNFLHIRYFFPYEFKVEAVNDIARFLFLINKTLDFTGFGMSEVDRLIYYRHDLFCQNSKVNSQTLKGILGYLLLIVDSFGPTIEQLSSQEMTFAEIVEKALKNE
jgi:hypothetical protein